MCDFIDSACLMANVFLTCKDRNSFLLHEVRSIGDAVETRLRSRNVVVMWTQPSVLSAVQDYSDMFVKEHREVRRAESSQDLFSSDFVDAEFNARLPKPIVSEMREAIRESCAKV